MGVVDLLKRDMDVWRHTRKTGLQSIDFGRLFKGAIVSVTCGCVVRIDNMKSEGTRRFMFSRYLRVTLLSRNHPPTGVRCAIHTSRRLALQQAESYQWMDVSEPCFEPPDALAAELGAKFV